MYEYEARHVYHPKYKYMYEYEARHVFCLNGRPFFCKRLSLLFTRVNDDAPVAKRGMVANDLCIKAKARCV